MITSQLSSIRSFVIGAFKHSPDSQHGIDHLKRVNHNALKITNKLNLEKSLDLNLMSAICWLHDLTFIDHHFGPFIWITESYLIKKKLTKTLPLFDLDLPTQSVILKAVTKHPYSFPFKPLKSKQNDYYTRILQDADLLDQFSDQRYKTFFNPDLNQNLFLNNCFSRAIFKFGRKHIRSFLNYPQLASAFNY